MATKYNSLEIFEDYNGWTYRFHGDILTYTQGGFDSLEEAFEAAKENDRVKKSIRPIRIVTTENVAIQLGLDLTDGARSVMPRFDLIAIPIGK